MLRAHVPRAILLTAPLARSPVIVAVTLDPAVHVSYESKRIVAGNAHRVGRVRYRAGGRGPAVAGMLQRFGHEVVAAGLAGGTAGELIRAELARRGVPTQFTPIAMESRRVVEVTDTCTGTMTSFTEPAPYITTEELGRLAADYRGLLDGASAVVLCGGLPDGLPPETFGTFATYAAEAGVPVVLDAGGSTLRHAAARRPALVVPEFPDGSDDPNEADAAAEPALLVTGGAGAVATMTGAVVSVVTAHGTWRAQLSGAGGAGSLAMSRDALVAGLVPGVVLRWSWPDSLRHAVSLAAAAGPDGEVDLAAYERLLPDVVIDAVIG
jgi:tagatose 6-phosphate kinase